jgi:hypothetical protein
MLYVFMVSVSVPHSSSIISLLVPLSYRYFRYCKTSRYYCIIQQYITRGFAAKNRQYETPYEVHKNINI